DSPKFSLICRADLLNGESPISGQVNGGAAGYLAELYHQHGDSFVNSVRGAFAIVIYDHDKSLLKAWTDHFGIQRLVFAVSHDCVALATDPRLLLPLFRQRPDIDPTAIQQYVQYACIPAPKTIYKGIQRLKPGHQLVCKPRPIMRPYWDMTYQEH